LPVRSTQSDGGQQTSALYLRQMSRHMAPIRIPFSPLIQACRLADSNEAPATAGGFASAPYRFVIVDLTTHRVVRICGTATVCTVAVANGKGVHSHEGEILRSRGIVIARSVSVKVTWR
jgi:hypothetical protein